MMIIYVYIYIYMSGLCRCIYEIMIYITDHCDPGLPVPTDGL